MAASLLAVPSVASQAAAGISEGPLSPRQWPNSYLAAPELEGWPNAVRMWGPDRHQTALAITLTLRGNGGYPFDSADATSGGGRSLAAADHWWGLGVCPRSIIVVASDVPADAVTAASLSDSTGLSSEPYLRRVAASDPLFDPIGGFARVDTFAAPILLTDSTRTGATSLNHAARLAAQDLRTGGCNAARQAIIVGGPAAVPTEVEQELVAIGYGEVFRVSGLTRYGTAAAVAQSLGTSPVPPNVVACEDPSATDGRVTTGFYANSVVEWRSRASRCELLGSTVVLAVGLDALAAGWWTSYWQVPVLLHDGSDELPVETAVALSLLDVENLIVLGDTTQVPPTVAELAAQIARAEVRRVAGTDRYDTSVEMAKIFGGWWPSAASGSFARSSLCLAALSDQTQKAKGWPDALGAGAFCGAASAPSPSDTPYVAERLVGPLDGFDTGLVKWSRRPATTLSGQSAFQPTSLTEPQPTHTAVPMLLVPAGATELPPPVDDYLREVFKPDRLCSQAVGGLGSGGAGARDPAAYITALNTGQCAAPGLALAFGGEAVITAEVLAQTSWLAGGRLTPVAEPLVPLLVGAVSPHHADPSRIEKAPRAKRGVGAFATRLPFDGTLFHRADADGTVQLGEDRPFGSTGTRTGTSAGAGHAWVCLPRATYGDARWLVVEESPDRAPLLQADLTQLDWYTADADGVPRNPSPASPGCLAVDMSATLPTYLRAVGPYGTTSRPVAVAADANRRLWLSSAVEDTEPVTGGVASDAQPAAGGTTLLAFRLTDPGVYVHLPPNRYLASEVFVSVEIQRGTRSVGGDTNGGTGSGTGSDAAGVGEFRDEPDTFSARWTVETAVGNVTGIAEGEARFLGDRWELRGMSAVRAGSWMSELYGPGSSPTPALSGLAAGAAAAGLANGGYGAGGFVASIAVNMEGSSDDSILWQVDAFINAEPLP